MSFVRGRTKAPPPKRNDAKLVSANANDGIYNLGQISRKLVVQDGKKVGRAFDARPNNGDSQVRVAQYLLPAGGGPGSISSLSGCVRVRPSFIGLLYYYFHWKASLCETYTSRERRTPLLPTSEYKSMGRYFADIQFCLFDSCVCVFCWIFRDIYFSQDWLKLCRFCWLCWN